jgi:multidrug efflux pump subunit AcrA (membrane-fusion protein)
VNLQRPGTSLVVAALAAIVHSGCTHGTTVGADSSAKAVRMVVVEFSTSPEPTTYSAIVAPNAQVDLAFRVPGYVVGIHHTRAADGRIRPLEPGASVAAGLTLARVRASDYRAVVDKAQGAADESNSGVNAAEAQLAEAQAGLAQADSDFARIATLWQQESITQPAYDGSKAKLDIARARVDGATAAVAAARQRSTSAGAQLQEARIALGDTELRSPFDGILLERRVDVGTLVAAGTPAFVVADLRFVKVHFSIPDTALHEFRTGQPLPLTVDAFGDERFEGRILSVAAAADPKSRSFEITVALANPDLRLRSGMIASIRVGENGPNRRQMRIPIDALVHDPTTDRYLVYTVEQRDRRTVAKAVPIRPGPLAGNQVSILDGLRAGQRIVASGANLLRPGDVVKEIQ